MPAGPPIVEIFAELGIKISVRTGKEIKYRCPFHKSSRQQSHNASMNEASGAWNCYNGSCGARGKSIIGFVAKLKQWSVEYTREWIKKHFGYDEDTAVFDEYKPKPVKGLRFRRLPNTYRALRYDDNLVTKDGFSFEVLQQLRVGYDLEKDGDTFVWAAAKFIPFYLHQELVGWGYRFDEGGYHYLPDFTKSLTLYGYDSAAIYKDHVVLCEGPRDVWRIRTHGMNAVAICGSSFSTKQANLVLKTWKKVYLCFDHDKAGHGAILKALKEIGGMIPIYIILLPVGADPCEIKTKEDWNSLEIIRGDEYDLKSYF